MRINAMATRLERLFREMRREAIHSTTRTRSSYPTRTMGGGNAQKSAKARADKMAKDKGKGGGA